MIELPCNIEEIEDVKINRKLGIVTFTIKLPATEIMEDGHRLTVTALITKSVLSHPGSPTTLTLKGEI